MKNIFVFILGFLIVCSSVTNLQAQHKKTKWLNGSWTGIGYQPAAMDHEAWNIFLDYDYKNGNIAINYPDFPCSGRWELVKSDKNKAEFVEYIEEGKNLCNNQGKVVVTKIDERYITVSYFLPEVMAGVIAFSTLERTYEE